MIRRLPPIPTTLVALAVAVMIGLGIWQLGRAEDKGVLIAQYSAAQDLPPIAFPTVPVGKKLPLFRHAAAVCLRPVARRVTAGRNRMGETGYLHIVECSTGAEGPGLAVEVGWSKSPAAAIRWSGGPVSGIIAPDSRMRMRIVAATAPPGLEASAPPSIESIPNNHLMYAVQWFLFAIVAVVIYLLAVRKRLGSGELRP